MKTTARQAADAADKAARIIEAGEQAARAAQASARRKLEDLERSLPAEVLAMYRRIVAPEEE